MAEDQDDNLIRDFENFDEVPIKSNITNLFSRE